MFIKRHLMKVLRWGLRLHGVGHLIEVFSAIAEGAYITATIAFTFISIEILASFFIPDDHVLLRPFKSEFHDDCCNEEHK